MSKKQKKMLIRIIIAAAMLAALYFVPLEGWPRFALYMVPYLIIGYDILLKAAKGIIRRQLLDECFLMTVASLGAIAIALISGSGDYVEAAAVMLFYQIGEWFQSYAVGKSRRNIGALMDIRPDYANLETADGVGKVDPDEVEVGSIIVVRPGEKIPIDGIVESGESSLDTSALTGESVPRDAAPGSEVISGSISLSGVLRIRTTKEFGQSTASRILELVENAGSRKSKAENFISRFARIYTPAVCGAALALALLPPVISLIAGADPRWGQWVYRALTFLVISCPCALVISIPLTFFAGIGGAGRAGILVKGSNYLEALSRVETVVFDKTGTLTKGEFEVNDIHHATMDRERLLYLAAHAESASSHPIAGSIRRAYGGQIDDSAVTDITEHSGRGITAKVDGSDVAVGNLRLMNDVGLEVEECHSVGTVIHTAVDGAYAGHLVISDSPKERSADAIAALKTAGVKRTVMLTGDAASIAGRVAQQLGIDEVRSELLPADKVAEVERLLGEKGSGTLAFVGDGINDAPVLARADVGIAMGQLGSDAAIEAADVVIMDDDPIKVPKAIRIARRCLRIVHENIWFAIGIKLLCLALGALGIANMWLAIFADVGVMVLAVLNAIRAMFVKKV